MCFKNGRFFVGYRLTRGGNNIRDVIAHQTSADIVTAENNKTKINYLEGNEAEPLVKAAVKNEVDSLIYEISKVADFYWSRTNEMLSCIILCGGASLMPGFENYFKSSITIPVYNIKDLMELQGAGKQIQPSDYAYLFNAYSAAFRGGLNMKQDLNLIVKKSSDSKKSKTLLYLLLVVVILGALVYLGISIPAGIKNVAIQQKTAVEMQINALASVKDKFAQQMKAQADITQSIALVQELEDNKKDLNQILDYIEKTCPKEVTIFSYKFSPDALELDGYADTDVFLSNFIQGLRQNADFKTVIVKQTQAEALKQKFALTILYAKPLRAGSDQDRSR